MFFSKTWASSLPKKFWQKYWKWYLSWGGGQKKRFRSGPIMWVSYFGLCVAGPQMCRLGLITLSKGIRFPIFSQISLIFVDLHLFLLTFFLSLYYLPHFWQFLCLGLLYCPALFIFRAACGTPVMLRSLTGSSFGTQLFFWLPPLWKKCFAIKKGVLFWKRDVSLQHGGVV